MVMDGKVSIKIPAGTYDYAVAAPQAGKKIWIAGNGGTGKGRADDFVFEAGKTYRFLMKRFGNYDGVELTVTNLKVSPARLWISCSMPAISRLRSIANQYLREVHFYNDYKFD